MLFLFFLLVSVSKLAKVLTKHNPITPISRGQHATPLAGAAGLPGSLGSRRLYSIVPWGDMLYLA